MSRAVDITDSAELMSYQFLDISNIAKVKLYRFFIVVILKMLNVEYISVFCPFCFKFLVQKLLDLFTPLLSLILVWQHVHNIQKNNICGIKEKYISTVVILLKKIIVVYMYMYVVNKKKSQKNEYQIICLCVVYCIVENYFNITP